MDLFKIENFHKAIHLAFPAYLESEISTITQYIENKLSISNYLHTYEKIQAKPYLVDKYNALNSDFSIKDVFNSYHLECDTVNIIWDINDKKFDRISFPNFSNYFEYIWYPAIDDILICDNNVSFIMFIRHDGVIYCIK